MEHLVRLTAAQTFTRSVVKPIDRLVDLLVTDSEEVGALGKVLTQQAIGVLVESTLPGVIGMREIHIRIQAPGNERVFCKLFAVVKRDRQALAFLGAQQFDDALSHTRAVPGVRPLAQGVARIALHQGDQRAPVVFADDGYRPPSRRCGFSRQRWPGAA